VANIKSAIKRVKIAERNRLRNKAYKSAVKTLMKKCYTSIAIYGRSPSEETKSEVNQTISAAYSKIDKAVKRRVLHQNNGNRKKAKLAKAFKQVTLAADAAVSTT